MDVTLAKKDLLRLFGRTQGVAEKKSTMPILSNVLVQAEADLLRASATDLFMAVSATSNAEVTRTGSRAVPAKEFLDRVKAMPEGPVQIRTTESEMLQIKAVGAKREFRLRAMRGEDFPVMPQPDAKCAEVQLLPQLLSDLISHTHFSISNDETRPYLNSANFEWQGDMVRMVSTDGHRLTKYDVMAPSMQDRMHLLIPLKGVMELRRLCDESKADKEAQPIRILTGGPHVFFTRSDMVLSIKLVDAKFPDYTQVIPKEDDRTRKVAVGRSAFMDVLRAVSIAASDKTGSVRLAFAKDALRVTSENPDSGEAFDELPIDYQGRDIVIGFNGKYLLDVLSSLDEEEIEMRISGELDPVVISPVSDRKYLGIVMPMRI